MRIDNPSILGTLQLQNNSRSDLSGSFTGSFLGTLVGTAATASYVQGTAVEGFTAFSSSAAGRISDLETFSSSLDTVYATDSELAGVSSSIVSTISTVSSSFSTRVSDLETDSGSFSTRVSTNETNISTLTSQTSSYLLNTTDTLTGDLTVTGKITAQEFHTEFVSASIIYQSGSTKFGDTSDDVMQITGSLQQSGSNSYFLGSVGIGTTSPSYKLHIEDNSTGTQLRLQSSSSNGTSLSLQNSATNGRSYRIGSNFVTGNGELAFYDDTAGAERMRITSTGLLQHQGGAVFNESGADVDFRVEASGVVNALFVDGTNGRIGINTGTPSEQFHLVNSDDAVIKIESDGTDSTDDARIELTTTNGNFSIQNDRSLGTSGALTIAGNTSNNLVIDHNNGNVGIGTNSPRSILDIATSSTEALFIANSSTTVSSGDLLGAISFGSRDTSTYSSGGVTGIRSYATETFNTSTVGGDLRFYTISGAQNVSGDTLFGTERMRIDSSGNVGIGTTSPTSGKLHITHGNELGIYTAGSYNFQAKFESTDSEAAIVIEDSNSTNDGNRIGVIGDNMTFITANSEHIRIDSSGNVGIGTTNPDSELDVDGTLTVSNKVRITGISGNRVLNYNWVQGAGSTKSYKIASLPASTTGTYDHIKIEGVSDDNWGANQKTPFLIVAGNRNGFKVKYLYGTTGQNSHIDFYTEADGTVSVWAVLDGGTYTTYALDITSNFQVNTYPDPTSGTPTGTLSWSSATAHPHIFPRPDNTLAFGTNDTEAIRIDSSGKVGIGTTSPDANSKLHVYRAGGSYDTIVADGDAGTNTGFAIYEAGNPRYALYSNGSGGDDSFNVYNFGAGSNSLTIDTSGNVGIGATNPDSNYTMTVEGLGTSSTSTLYLKRQGDPQGLYINAGAGVAVYNSYEGTNTVYGAHVWTATKGSTTVERMRIDNSGNVGIGTASPGAKLQIQADGIGLRLDGTPNTTRTIFIRNTSSTNPAQIYSDGSLRLYTEDAGTDIRFHTVSNGSNNERMRIDSSGNVGIGTTSPVGNLHINGSSTSRPQVNINNAYYVFAANTTKSQSNTHTITIPFTSQGSNYAGFVVEILFTASWGGGDTPIRGGRATYAFNTLNAIVDLTEIEDIGIDVTFAGSSSGMSFIVTATTTSNGGQEPDRIGAVARIIRNNPSVDVYPLSMTIA